MSPLTLTSQDLLRNKPKEAGGPSSNIEISSTLSSELPSVLKLKGTISRSHKLKFDDGLSGALLSRTKEFITSPNCNYIPEPPSGSTRDLFRRSDARYGPDDPICWPQPYNPKYPFLAAISKRPVNGSRDELVLWMDLVEEDLEFTDEGKIEKKGVVKKELIEKLANKVNIVRTRVNSFLSGAPEHREFLRELQVNMELCLRRISQTSSSLRDLQRGLTEVQRGCLMSRAFLEYQTEVIKKYLDYIEPQDVDHNKMGCFVVDDREAHLFYITGYPVFYVRPWSDFDRQVILRVTEPIRPTPPTIQIAQADPPYNPIATTQAGSDEKYLAIRKSSIECFRSSTPNSFQNLHLPGGYQSSYSVGIGRILAPTTARVSTSVVSSSADRLPHTAQVTRGHKRILGVHGQQGNAGSRGYYPRKQARNPPKAMRDIFDDFPQDDPSAPAMIPSWTAANKTIHHSGIHNTRQKLMIAPDPGLFFGLETSARQAAFLAMWNHIRPAWQASLSAGRSPIPLNLWRKVLSYTFLKPLDLEPGQEISNQAKVAEEARKLVEDTIKGFDPNMDFRPSELMTLDSTQCRRLIRELTLVNFGYELGYVDSIVDQSKPLPRPGLSADDLEILLIAHKRNRQILINDILGYDTIQPPEANLGIAATDWPERYAALRSFWLLLNTWPGEKPLRWKQGHDLDLTRLQGIGGEWEGILVQFYVQSVFNVLIYPPCLPHRIFT